MRRWLRGVASLAALLGLLVGVPVLLAVLGGSPLPADRSGAALWRALRRPDDGTVLVGLVTVVGWLAWLVFAVSVVAELSNLLRRPRFPVRLPGLGGVQRWTAGLMLAVLALLAVRGSAPPPAAAPTAPAQVAPRDPATLGPAPLDWAPPGPAPLEGPRAEGPSRDARREPLPAAQAGSPRFDRVHHTVRAGDDLWSLAERYYGQGRDWRRIAHANRGLLTGGPDRLRIGWKLVIPGVDPGSAGRAPSVRVRPGDSLTAIARRELGSGARWPELFRANRDQLSDPDEIPVGISLVLPHDHARSGSGDGAERAGRERPHHDAPPGSGDAAEHAERERSRERSPKRLQPDARNAQDAPPARSERAPDRLPTAPPPVRPEPGAGSERAEADAPAVVPSSSPTAVPLGLSAVGGLLAAGLVAALARRRRVQLQDRPLGRRIVHPPASVRPAEVALGRRARPLSLRTVDQAMRAIAAHSTTTGAPLPALQLAYLGEAELELVLSEPSPDAPLCFTVDGRRWRLSRTDARYLSSVPGLSEASRPWPGLVSLGTDDSGRDVLADLEGLGLLGVRGSAEAVRGVLAALVVELTCAPWNEELTVSLLGGDTGLAGVLGQQQVVRCDDVEALLDRLERRAQHQREYADEPGSRSARLDPDRSEAWALEVVVVGTCLETDQRQRLTALIQGRPRVSVAAVASGTFEHGWTLDLDADGRGRLRPEDHAELTHPGVTLSMIPQTLPPPALEAVVELVAATGSTQTTPAPWWADQAPPTPSADRVTAADRGSEKAGGEEEGAGDEEEEEAAGEGRLVIPRTPGWPAARSPHPTVGLLGPLQLLGAAGPPPPRAPKQCLEYCAWLLEHPGATAQAMAAALFVAEGTRRSNMSRLRSWLGSDPDGQPYLPDAYSGHIRLHPDVGSDWQQVQLLTAAGVNRASAASLERTLDLVRGAPLADAAPGQWCWAEELRTDMVSCLRDVGVELAGRALEVGDVDLARWAAARALVAAPGDELLLAVRVRTEHRAGNVVEIERLSRQLTQQSQLLRVDLDPATVTLLQEAMEGRARARTA